MPLFIEETVEDTVAPTLKEVIVPKETATVYTNTEIDSSDFELEGFSWTGTYYSQVLAADDSPRRLDLHLSPTLQQYVRINKMSIMVEESPSPSTDEQTITTVEGTGKMYASHTPNAGDMFVASIRDGNFCLFVITHVERQSYYSGSIWEVTFQMVDYIKDIYQANLDIKVVKELYFSEESKKCIDGLSSVINVGEVYNLISMVTTRIWDEFYDLLSESVILPYNGSCYYDHSVNAFLTKIVPYNIYRRLPKLREYNIPANGYAGQFNTLWDVLAFGQLNQLDFISTKCTLMSKTDFISGNIYTGVGYAQIDGVVHPSGQASLFGMNTFNQGNGYIFSSAFYDGHVEQMEDIERYIFSSLNGATIGYAEVYDELRKALKEESPSKRFYLFPLILWLLIRLT